MGRLHLLCDLWIEDVEILERVAPWREILLGAAEQIGATVIGQQFHQLRPVASPAFCCWPNRTSACTPGRRRAWRR